MIEPILEALGWDIRDPDEVHREFKPTSKDSPVDYALKIMRKPRLFVEAKGLDENLSDRKWIAQVLGYATVAGVEWCVLSDGDEYRFYNATAALDAEEKLFHRLRLSECTPEDAAKTLKLISRTNMEENILDVLWAAHFVDRRVREALRGMMVDSVDKGLIRLIRRGLPKLSPKEIAESIRRLEIRIEPPPALPDVMYRTGAARVEASKPLATVKPARKSAGSKQSKTRRAAFFNVSLKELIEAEFLTAPLRVFRNYRQQLMEALVNRDGTVTFEGKNYETPSSAAAHARGTITGQPMATNGWDFWLFVDQSGKKKTLDDARQEFIRRNA
ncbi:MAG: hypothetical protein IT428_03585 [Planctomycetaceae bacterium]|nr:hypothetical protein [Planctomycetaceae bacterium]